MQTTECNSARPSVYEPIVCRVESVGKPTAVQRQLRVVRLDRERFVHRPGQFVQVSAFGIGEAPLSVASSPTRPFALELAVRKVGSVTRVLHELAPGERIGVRGPFGAGFDIESMRGKDVVLVAGGCGLAAMSYLRSALTGDASPLSPRCWAPSRQANRH